MKPYINSHTLLSILRASDAFFYPSELSLGELAFSEAAIGYASSANEIPYDFSRATLKNKPVFSTNNLYDEILLRAANACFRLINKVKQQDRNAITLALSNILSESYPYTIFRLDFESFYESIDIDVLHEKINSDIAYPPSLKELLKKYFQFCHNHSISLVHHCFCNLVRVSPAGLGKRGRPWFILSIFRPKKKERKTNDLPRTG